MQLQSRSHRDCLLRIGVLWVEEHQRHAIVGPSQLAFGQLSGTSGKEASPVAERNLAEFVRYVDIFGISLCPLAHEVAWSFETRQHSVDTVDVLGVVPMELAGSRQFLHIMMKYSRL
jgi:hypothetical protein